MTEPGANGRRASIETLAAAPSRAIAAAWESWADKPEFEVVRGPEIGLVMVRARTGGDGAPFNFGEATVTRASVKLATGEVGHSYALGRDTGKAVTAAVFDALWQRAGTRAAVEASVLAPLRAMRAQGDERLSQETAATRVDFFTMVRGDD
jgi:alpha-D-ribose 1-methylphosphonate 5-triphosphate synthase subunit PhnG